MTHVKHRNRLIALTNPQTTTARRRRFRALLRKLLVPHSYIVSNQNESSSAWRLQNHEHSLWTHMERRTPRFPCSASAELTWDHSTELTRVSRYVCFPEAARSLSAGTRVTLKIMDTGRLFEATATVLYARLNFGMRPWPSGNLRQRFR